MKRHRFALISAVGLVGGMVCAQIGSPTPATTPAVVEIPGANLMELTRSVRDAGDPSSAVANYAAAVTQVGAHAAIMDAYVRRMVEFGLPDMADAQARELVKVDPKNSVARAAVAYMQGRRGRPVEALANIVQAAHDDQVSGNPFVVRTAGQLVAWYDTLADQAQIPEPLKTDVEAMRARLSPQTNYSDAYSSARDLYQGKTAAATPAPIQPQQQQPQQQVPSGVTSNVPPTGGTVQQTAPTEAAPPVIYDNSNYATYPNYVYTSPGVYYGPSYYPYSYYGYGGYSYPGYRYYIPPVSNHHDWNHGHDWDHGYGGDHGHDWNHGGDHHDGDHGGGTHGRASEFEIPSRGITIPESNAQTYQHSQQSPHVDLPQVQARSNSPAVIAAPRSGSFGNHDQDGASGSAGAHISGGSPSGSSGGSSGSHSSGGGGGHSR